MAARPVYHPTARGVTLFEGLVTAFIMFLILSAVVTLLQTSLRAMKTQQGREITEMAFVSDLLRRDVGDAISVNTTGPNLTVRRYDYTVPWQELLLAPGPTLNPKIVQVLYSFQNGELVRESSVQNAPEPLLSLLAFEVQKEPYEVRVKLEAEVGQRNREFRWSIWCPRP